MVLSLYTSAQVSLEPLKPFKTIVEVIVKRKTGGGRWRYEFKVEATEADPDDHIFLRAPVGGQSSAMFRLCNRYLGYAPFQVRVSCITNPLMDNPVEQCFDSSLCCLMFLSLQVETLPFSFSTTRLR